MAKNWYAHSMGDYARKTGHLSMLEHGAYRLLLDHYYSTGKPLPADHGKLYNICKARTPTERKAVLAVAACFFTQVASELVNKRCDREIAKSLKISEVKAANAKQKQSGCSANDPLRARVPTTTTTTTVDNPPNTENGAAPAKGVFSDEKIGGVYGFNILHILNDRGLAAAKEAAPGWDIYNLAEIYNEGVQTRGGPPANPNAAFAAWCKSYTKGKAL